MILAAALGLVTAAWSAEAPDPPDPLQALARKAIAKNDLAFAQQVIDDVLAQEPENVEWKLLKADWLEAVGEVRDALAAVQAILEDQPGHRRAHFREAQLLSQMGRLRSAQSKYETYLEGAPDDVEARNGLGLALSWSGDWRRAVEVLLEALELAPDHEAAFYSLVRTLANSGQVSLAWSAARERDRLGGEVDPELGLILAQLAARVSATELVETLASRPALDPDLRRRQAAFLALYLIQHGRYEEGFRKIQGFAQLESTDYDALIDAADAYATADQRGRAREFFERAIRVTPYRPEARLGLARLASREGRLSGSLTIYERVVAENPESLEGWLGVIRTAQLLNEQAVVKQALERAWEIAPHSALLHQEELRLALQGGDAEAFRRALVVYLADQPEDRMALLWEQRWARLTGAPVYEGVLPALLDPLSPELTAQALRLLVAQPAGFALALERASVLAGEGELEGYANTALAEQLALLAQPVPPAYRAGRARPETQAWIDALYQGWWAYLSTPLAFQAGLSRDFDAQALTVWLTREVERRLRTLQIETGSGLEDEWRLARALWFSQWRGRWDSAAAVADLRQRLEQLVPGWGDPVREDQIGQAWRGSEQPLPIEAETLPHLLTRARWRHYRFEYLEALALLRRLEGEYPLATEPAELGADLLRASGRFAEAADHYRGLAEEEHASPGIRLHYAELLRQQGRRVAAERQLDLLQQARFDEPEYYLQRADLARSGGLDHQAWAWLERGLQAYPSSPALRLLKAEWLLKKQEPQQLAEVLADGPVPGWINPDFLAGAWPHLTTARGEAILRSPTWWFSWQWLPWVRISARSLGELERKAEQALMGGQPEMALQYVLPGLQARLPDSGLWFRAARLLDYARRVDESTHAFELAVALGLGRADARLAALTQLARRRPIEAARQFAQIVEERPDDTESRKGLVTALLRGGEVAAADRALSVLVETDPENPELPSLAAEVRGAMGRVQQARSLYGAILRDDPLAVDVRTARTAWRDAHEWGVSTGYEYDFRQSKDPAGGDPGDWQEAFVSAFWRQPLRQTWSFEYHWYDRLNEEANQVLGTWTTALDRDWILELNGGVALTGEAIPKWRAGAGVNRRFLDNLFGTLDFSYLSFRDVQVAQLAPSVLWRWHPRSTVETRLYLSENFFDIGSNQTGWTWVLNGSWELGRQSSIALNYAIGNEDNLDPVPGLIGEDQFQSAGVTLRLGWRHRWVVQPTYRFETHETYRLHGLGLGVSCRF